MAFQLAPPTSAAAAPGAISGALVPRESAPQLREAYRRAIPFQIALTGVTTGGLFFATCLGLFDMLGVTPFALLRDSAGGVAGWLLVVSLVPFAFMPLTDGLTSSVVGVLGWASRGAKTVSGHHSLAPGALRRLPSAVRLVAAGAATVLAGVLALLFWNPDPEQTLLIVVLTVPIAGMLLTLGIRPLPAASRAWRAGLAHAELTEHIRATGRHSTAVVTDVEHRGWWLDQQPVFRVRAETREQPVTTLEFQVAEYPRWAPAPGHVIDVWARTPQTTDSGDTGDTGGFDPEHTVVERQIVGQQFDSPGEELRRPASGGDGPAIGPVAPHWADVFNPGAGTPGAWTVGVVAGLVAVAGAFLAPAAWFTGDPDGPAWLPWSLGAAVLVTMWQSAEWLGLRLMPRRAVGRGTTTLMPGILAFLLMFVNILSAVFTWGLSDHFLDGDRGGPVALTCLGSVVAGVIPFILAVAGHGALVPTVTSALLAAARRRTGGTDAVPLSAEHVHEAMLSGDPARTSQLERDHGFAVGRLLRA
ncbi:hypothetical protein [Streptomyces sp. ML-6]|uniref:hypothetical protein n=1 Tax=Streptomyces sp. ML-6 TaxID=2982693 RepID=UPI0024C04DEF|nr:hypothetical protein [Streptomyces sp. ML-6]MDK0524175.1 hypothetical protein [Streptomyces sp. ML-6]